MKYPSAIQYPGPQDKQGYPGVSLNAARGIICHSMVGSADNALGRLESADRASWHFSVTKTGKVLQHYDSLAVAWHAGSPGWNERLIGIEHEGGPPGDESEPLTPEQLAASVALVQWLAQQHQIPLQRANGGTEGLFEHNEVYQTACPSGRIPWAMYIGGEPMNADEKKAFDALVTAHADLQQQVTSLANGTDAVLKGALRYLWALAGKAWPWPKS